MGPQLVSVHRVRGGKSEGRTRKGQHERTRASDEEHDRDVEEECDVTVEEEGEGADSGEDLLEGGPAFEDGDEEGVEGGADGGVLRGEPLVEDGREGDERRRT